MVGRPKVLRVTIELSALFIDMDEGRPFESSILQPKNRVGFVVRGMDPCYFLDSGNRQLEYFGYDSAHNNSTDNR